MRTRPFIAVAAVLTAFVVLGGVTYAYDRSRHDTIAKGVRVAGVDVGGMKADAARAKLETSIQERLQQPVVLRRGDATWKLRARRAHVRANVDAMVDQALERSRDGNALTRSMRSITGRSLDADLKPTVTFDERAVNRLVRHVRDDVERPPRDAKVTIDGSGLRSVKSRPGLEVRTKKLRARVRAELVSLSSDRTVAVRTRSIKPKVSSQDADREYKTAIVVNRSAFQLTLYKDLKPYKTYGIAVGQVGLETPAGLYHIQNKAVNPAWSVPNSPWAGSLAGTVVPGGSPENPLKARWMGIYNGAGIHGTSEDASIGSAASHGCIRMHIPDVIDLYDRVPVGAPVYIA